MIEGTVSICTSDLISLAFQKVQGFKFTWPVIDWMFVFPLLIPLTLIQFTVLRPNPQGDVIWRGGLGKSLGLEEVVRVGLNAGISALEEETPQSLLSFHHVKTQQESSCLQGRKWALMRHWISCYLDVGLSSLQNCENKFQLFKQSNLWYFLWQPEQTKPWP